MKKIVVGVGGSSGAIYAKRLFDKLALMDDLQVAAVFSSNALINWELELGVFDKVGFPFPIFDAKDFFAPFASGSAQYETMVVCPCSVGLLARLASGTAEDLIGRAADVMLKERRKLIIVPRETPLNLIHLRNMVQLTEAGAIICPAMPSFYSKPQTINDVVDTVVDRIIDLMQLSQNTYRWGNGTDRPL
ncbi:MAG: UbiX family flavin prenyltransferase [Saprospiraceae bacterium]|nr:UbiX family flavin prenyltransferase [Saprospiraceae bacterium]